ncbi:MAG: Holliday junction branch migration protein RuvA [Candidatus Magasanikbacteria bacterium CG10_big_fil_rev_8_21_14_0_10_47_10]|uniref:Holliday junction branch migration complex subunit RuvA n=1 Tax=Candidatus Magasanikbacteria bacterium CG10_big_fil_rev_8_21_14_0_10_47_10 TaxID=1974652 RepID=A0A2H0TRN5_9BACT|nr:MAG: Holliday junction branch migration protein RuvA [Candidatus Magasanikbacteria bacterium CG10_big_fil_rev_8_21_14_0_10_47_10]
MITFISGTIQHKTATAVVILTQGGIGYEVRLPRMRVAQLAIGKTVSLYTYMKVSESAMELFGFDTPEEKEFFELLLSVKSVGPKSAMNILSLGSISDIKSAIARGDATYLSAVQGMGKKTAERLCVELKSKVTFSDGEDRQSMGDSGILAEVIDALTSMGYSKDEAKAKVMTLETEGKSTEEILRQALRG